MSGYRHETKPALSSSLPPTTSAMVEQSPLPTPPAAAMAGTSLDPAQAAQHGAAMAPYLGIDLPDLPHQAHPTGNAGIDNAGKGVAKQPGENFLTGAQRGILVSEYIGRVNAAHTQAGLALASLEMDLKTEPTELPFMAEVIITAGTAAFAGTVMAGLKSLRKLGAVNELAEAHVHGVAEAEAEHATTRISEGSLDVLLDAAKDRAKGTIRAPVSGAEASEEKAEALSYIAYLQDATMALFEQMREQPIGAASDARLLALFAAFKGEHHTQSLYRTKYKHHADVFMHSRARDIGHRVVDADASGRRVREEVRVAWVIENGAKMLAYMSNSFRPDDMPGGFSSEPGAAYTTNEKALGFDQHGPWEQHGHETQGVAKSSNREFESFVEPEVQDAALAAHRARWREEPKTYQMAPPTMALVEVKS